MNEKSEIVQPLNSLDPKNENHIPETDFSVNMSTPAPVNMSPTTIQPVKYEPSEEELKSVTKPKWYRVVRGGPVLENGFRTVLKEGKEISTLNYNVKKLIQQGIRLVEFDPENFSDDVSDCN